MSLPRLFSRRALYTLLPIGAAEKLRLQATLDHETTRRILVFEKHWDSFIRKLFGCPPAGWAGPSTCNPSAGTLNYSDWDKAREAAKKLFDLKD